LRRFVQYGNVTAAARAARIHRVTAYKWRRSIPAFAKRWEEAESLIVEAAREELSERALSPERMVAGQERLLDKLRETSNDALVALLRYHDRRKLGHPRKHFTENTLIS
jgi:hypothetical protein